MARKADTTVALNDVEAINAVHKKREAKRDNALAEDMMYGKKAYKRNMTATQQERDSRYARLHDFYHNRNVSMRWDINPEMISKQLLMLKIDDKEIVLSAVELQKYLRWV